MRHLGEFVHFYLCAHISAALETFKMSLTHTTDVVSQSWTCYFPRGMAATT